jgi:hypothetical protein
MSNIGFLEMLQDFKLEDIRAHAITLCTEDFHGPQFMIAGDFVRTKTF